jgi:hypothetical protein
MNSSHVNVQGGTSLALVAKRQRAKEFEMEKTSLILT